MKKVLLFLSVIALSVGCNSQAPDYSAEKQAMEDILLKTIVKDYQESFDTFCFTKLEKGDDVMDLYSLLYSYYDENGNFITDECIGWFTKENRTFCSVQLGKKWGLDDPAFL